MKTSLTLLTIGHSNLSLEEFIAHLRQHGVTLLVDTRSVPASRHVPHFGKHVLSRSLDEAGIAYAYAGETLGGRPKDESVYLDGKISYEAVMQRDWYRQGIAQLLASAAETSQAAILCSEGDPRRCHRHHLIARSLLTQNPSLRASDQELVIRHILRDGTLEATLDPQTEFDSIAQQQGLF